jgi:hypothetical protein
VTSSRICVAVGVVSDHLMNFSPILSGQLDATRKRVMTDQDRSATGLLAATIPIVPGLVACSFRYANSVAINSSSLSMQSLSNADDFDLSNSGTLGNRNMLRWIANDQP